MYMYILWWRAYVEGVMFVPQTQTYLKETWIPSLRAAIRSCLAHVTKGWFNLEETSFEVYQGSKLKKLMELIKFAMQVRQLEGRERSALEWK